MTKTVKMKAWITAVLSVPRGMIAGAQIACGDIEKAARSMRKIYDRYRRAKFDDAFANKIIENAYQAAIDKCIKAGDGFSMYNTLLSRRYYREFYKTGIA